ncbi:MAG TPA: hypothetical protein PKA32_03980 [Candidatus Gracilibacteria bacterium]|nr:hypothetical protein [Candidatus Gracilibacteria bacterium]
MQHDDKPAREIDDTAGSAAEDRFEEILKRVKTAGAEIVKDEEAPLYTDIGMDQYEIGYERVVEFNMGGMDFQIVRQVIEVRIIGEGMKKSLQDLERPKVDLKLKRKPDTSSQWVVVDLEDMF